MKESGAQFHFNFRDVYWNSRLATEHARLINIIAKTASAKRNAATSSSCSSNSGGASATPESGKPGRSVRVVADMMAGVGPFAVPLGMKRSVAIYANGAFVCMYCVHPPDIIHICIYMFISVIITVDLSV